MATLCEASLHPVTLWPRSGWPVFESCLLDTFSFLIKSVKYTGGRVWTLQRRGTSKYKLQLNEHRFPNGEKPWLRSSVSNTAVNPIRLVCHCSSSLESLTGNCRFSKVLNLFNMLRIHAILFWMSRVCIRRYEVLSREWDWVIQVFFIWMFNFW